MTNKKCPICGSHNFQITDFYVRGYIYEVHDGIVLADGEDDGGERVRTTCVCRDCDHIWHPRNFDYTIDGDEL